ncbi:hypothetical protein Rsub_03563 [Raphidocelis subcapitata]|uniref:CARDB domain-containing protein n=1 Tax=Raphidocelis subcapitata TaxID=307507 RepID=A0A2V0P071_9CHLO|nr:hypothetical protein Rsub_03563 [Raphidocelis subcapitata]|eukprot:GBF91243.1 hypothetical protein Rsub_03563 [Raphidocelis subcapitata]
MRAPLLAAVLAALAATAAANLVFELESPRDIVQPNFEAVDPFGGFQGRIIPITPEVGKKIQTTMYITSFGTAPITGAVIAIWANKSEPAACGEEGEATFKIPEIVPLQTIAVPLKIKAPDTPGPATLRVFVDATCTGWNESARYNQQGTPYTVYAKGDKRVRLIGGEPSPADYGVAVTTPTLPIKGQTFSIDLPVLNQGTLASEPGVKMTLWGNEPEGINLTACGTRGDVTVDLPKIAPGKTKILTIESLPASADTYGWVIALMDPDCTLGPAPTFVRRSYLTAPAPAAFIRGTHAKGQYTYQVSTSPKKPKANSTMTAKIKVINDGGAEGPIGKVALYARKFIDTDGHYEGTVCNVTGYVALGDFSDVVLKPGKSKTVKVKDVPVPAGPAGWYELSAVLDAACASPITKDMYLQPAFNSFEVV